MLPAGPKEVLVHPGSDEVEHDRRQHHPGHPHGRGDAQQLGAGAVGALGRQGAVGAHDIQHATAQGDHLKRNEAIPQLLRCAVDEAQRRLPLLFGQHQEPLQPLRAQADGQGDEHCHHLWWHHLAEQVLHIFDRGHFGDHTAAGILELLKQGLLVGGTAWVPPEEEHLVSVEPTPLWLHATDLVVGKAKGRPGLIQRLGVH
mmetsp:Transcript_102762/g.244963  ORF Transcript_102762/g.244963 Transcript_102762/m.244963 type:complete len:201 (-) Transcript_102762:7-609(-)